MRQKIKSSLPGAYCHAPPPPPPLTLPFSKKDQKYKRQVTEICQALLIVSLAYCQGRIQGGRLRDMHPITSHFQKCF